MKKQLSLAMAGVMALSLAACGGSSASSAATSTAEAASSTAESTAESTAAEGDVLDQAAAAAFAQDVTLTMWGAEEDQDLLEDVLIEIKQAIEMSNIYLNILSGTMDAFASVISNNLNIVMKVLASVTIVISIPNIIAGFYGMNVEGLPLSQFFWFPIVLSVALMGFVGWLLHKKGML